jgi:hypothetical protein
MYFCGLLNNAAAECNTVFDIIHTKEKETEQELENERPNILYIEIAI